MADKKTIDAYRKLGKKYLDDTKDLIPYEFDDFCKLIPPKGKVLDAGCAGGRDCVQFHLRGFKTVGVDLVEEFIEEAKGNVPEGDFYLKDIEDLDFAKESFDAIWCTAVLLHIKQDRILSIVKNFNRMLKPEGKLFVALQEGIGEEYKRNRLSKYERFFSYVSRDEIRKIIINAGFKVIKLNTYPDGVGRQDVTWIRIIAEKK